jgi:hypothetical protein
MMKKPDRRSRKLGEFVSYIPIMAKTVVLVFMAMGALEVVKLFLFPAIPILSSEAMTIIFVIATSGLITHLVTREQRVLKARMKLERRHRIEAEEYLYQLKARLSNPFGTLQPLPVYAR